jgi:hypothetical protein
VTDAISPEFRLEPDRPTPFRPIEWEIDAEHALMLHRPTHALFSIYLAHGTNTPVPSVYQLRARLCHVCDGFPVPGELAALATAAINGFAIFTQRMTFAELQIDDTPPF